MIGWPSNVINTAAAAWINLTNPNGNTPGTVTVGVNIAGKTAGTYTDSVQVASASATNSPKWVKVVLTVTAVPKTLVVAPTTLNFTATEGGANPVDQSYNVSEQGGGAIGYSSTTNAAWINLTNPDGTTPGTVSGTWTPWAPVGPAGPCAPVTVPATHVVPS